jgi:lysophospholipase L1-like esterase
VEAAGRVRRRLALAAGFVVAGFTTLIGVELALLSRREFLPMDPGYVIDGVVPGPGGGTADPVTLAVLGDSTVAGVGSPTEAESLPMLIGERVAAGLGRPVRVTGYGISGARTATVLTEQLPRVAEPVDAVVLVVGSNDATHATFWPNLRKDAEELLIQTRSLAPVVVLAGTPRFHANQIIPEPLRTMVDRYAGVLRGQQRQAVEAVPGAAFVDLAEEASPRFLGVPEATSVDGFHPSPVGYGFWADALAPPVIDALHRTPGSDASH